MVAVGREGVERRVPNDPAVLRVFDPGGDIPMPGRGGRRIAGLDRAVLSRFNPEVGQPNGMDAPSFETADWPWPISRQQARGAPAWGGSRRRGNDEPGPGGRGGPFGRWVTSGPGFFGPLFEPGELSTARSPGWFELYLPWRIPFDAPPPPPRWTRYPAEFSCEWLREWKDRGAFIALPGGCEQPEALPLQTCAAPVENGEENVIEIAGLPDGNRAFVPASGELKTRMILHLHGVLNDVESPGASNVLRAYAQAGYRVLALAWNDDQLTAYQQCQTEESTDKGLNDCLYEVREASLAEIEAEMVLTLMSLGILDPDGAWRDFLTYDEDGRVVVEWARVVLSGYSEGAGQAAFMARRVDAFGLILISGGGDQGTHDEPDPLDLPIPADWMSDDPLVPSERVVGLRHVEEPVDYSVGWTLSGMPEDLPADGLADPPYSAFHGAHRPELSNSALQSAKAHTETVSNDGLFPAHMYLACRAGGALLLGGLG